MHSAPLSKLPLVLTRSSTSVSQGNMLCKGRYHGLQAEYERFSLRMVGPNSLPNQAGSVSKKESNLDRARKQRLALQGRERE